MARPGVMIDSTADPIGPCQLTAGKLGSLFILKAYWDRVYSEF
jgi:hypothetical protein